MPTLWVTKGQRLQYKNSPTCTWKFVNAFGQFWVSVGQNKKVGKTVKLMQVTSVVWRTHYDLACPPVRAKMKAKLCWQWKLYLVFVRNWAKKDHKINCSIKRRVLGRTLQIKTSDFLYISLLCLYNETNSSLYFFAYLFIESQVEYDLAEIYCIGMICVECFLCW